jgi:FkbM family methyltransferase
VAFADSHPKQPEVSGVPVLKPEACLALFPDAWWCATVLSLPASHEVPAWMREHSVKTVPLWQCLDRPLHMPPPGAVGAVLDACADAESWRVVEDQSDFYASPDYNAEYLQRPMSEIYFPDFITHLPDECFVDCGSAGADTEECAAFIKLWPSYRKIILIEPDHKNWLHLHDAYKGDETIQVLNCAVSDHTGEDSFLSTGDYRARLGDAGLKDSMLGTVACTKVDDLSETPTYLKMDVEGAELEALWGARQTIFLHSPVLAICLYHKPEHFWQIPLLIRAIQPSYRLYFRRYAGVPFELICYAVPAERVRRINQ